MAKLAELIHGGLPAAFQQEKVWSLCGGRPRESKQARERYSCNRKRENMFADGRQERPSRRRVSAHCGENVYGLCTRTIKTGAYSSCVCKSRVIL